MKVEMISQEVGWNRFSSSSLGVVRAAGCCGQDWRMYGSTLEDVLVKFGGCCDQEWRMLWSIMDDVVVKSRGSLVLYRGIHDPVQSFRGQSNMIKSVYS